MNRTILVGALEAVGATAVLVGLARIYEPVAWIVGGLGLLAVAIILEGGFGGKRKR